MISEQRLEDWRQRFGIRNRKPLGRSAVCAQLASLESDNQDLTAFYEATNGLSLAWLEIFPIFDPSDPHHTWQNLSNVNHPATTNFLGRDASLLKRFLVFGVVGDGNVAVLDRTDGTIWYEEAGQLRQTDLSLTEFIETCLKEINEL